MTEAAAELRDMTGPVRLEAADFGTIAGWRDDAQADALAAFIASGPKLLASIKDASERAIWEEVCAAAGEVIPGDHTAARRMLQNAFGAWRILPRGEQSGFLTGYFEPEVEGSLKKSDEFSVPIYRQPDDLVVLNGDDPRRPEGFTLAGARSTPQGLEPYPTRKEIEQGALAGKGLELVYVRDHITAFFIHVQGSARIRLVDGWLMRIGFAAKNGHPYTSIGRVVSETHAIPADQLTADRLRQWLVEHPMKADDVMWQNKSFIFFKEIDLGDPVLGPLGALGTSLTPLRSLAVDRSYHTLGAPIWIDAMLPNPNRGLLLFRRLMIAQDTGSAIVGPARGDIFFGSGAEAGRHAGQVRHSGRFIMLWPRELALPSWAMVGPS